MAWVVEAIEGGALSHGSPLPAERTLAEQLMVSRVTVKAAIADLIRAGVVGPTDGGRIRRVIGPQEHKTASVLRSTIALLSSTSEPAAGRRESGWLEYMAQGVVLASRAAGRNVLVVHPDQMATDGLERLFSAPPLGVVMPEPGGPLPGQDLWLRRLAAAGIPVVVYGDSDDLSDFDRVVSDHEVATYELTKWVIGQGRRRIINLSGKPGDHYWYLNRLRGHERAMREAGLEPRPPILFTPVDRLSPGVGEFNAEPWDSFDVARHQLAGHLAPLVNGNEPVDAIMLGNDGQVCATAAALRLLGREPGRDVLLVGYDNTWADSTQRQFETANPAATVDKCNAQIGQELVRLLMDRVEGRLPQGSQRRVVPSRLIVMEQDKVAGTLAGSKNFG